MKFCNTAQYSRLQILPIRAACQAAHGGQPCATAIAAFPHYRVPLLIPRVSAPLQIIRFCWVLFLVYWVIGAASAKRTAEPQAWSSILVHRIPTTLGGLLLFWPNPPGTLAIHLTPQTDSAGFAGAAVCILGLLLAFWARRTLAGNWSSTVTFKEGHELIERGPYRFVRHPIYTAILAMCLGTAIAAARLSAWLGLVLLFAGFWLKLRQEETLLTRHFPDEYPAYRARVKALIPFVV